MTEDQIAAWIDRLQHPRWLDRWGGQSRAAEELGNSGDPRAVAPLLAALEEGEPAVRQAAARALGKLGDRQAVPRLIAVLHDPWWSVRAAACQALGQLNDQRAWEPLLVHLLEMMHFTANFQGNLLALQDTEVFRALLRIEPRDPDQIQSIALFPEEHSTWLAALLWAHLGTQAGPSLQRSLGHRNRRVRKAAVQALGLLAQPETIPTLVDRLVHDEAYSVRKASAQALTSLGSEAEAALAAVLQHDDWEIRQLARNALREIASGSAQDLLKNRALSLVEVQDEAANSSGRELTEASPKETESTGRELFLRPDPSSQGNRKQ